MPQAHIEPLTYLDIYSRRKAFVTISWKDPPALSWYRSEGPGATIHFKGDSKDQTALARLTSGHLKSLIFSPGDKKFNICTKCNMIEATAFITATFRNIYLIVLPWCRMTCLSDLFRVEGDEGERPHGLI
ncbi:hypothetical protein AVEN_225098-1 [Araneus ventricosus]|uniref:Uncharacterized protein n=1 Tax=Araneus ventricosus TaxID=182803 RepID=A0A4Y2IBW5_ARAVE|nr:hypothetical protein AVEN_225098-1 [Araneus ventricosus]